MHKKDVVYTFINIILAHFIISVFAGLVFGVTHPLSFLYTEGQPYVFVIVSTLIAVPLYMIAGYLYVLGKNNLKGVSKTLLEAGFYFMLVLLVVYATCFVLVYYRIVTNAWVYYVLFNYPSALAFNNISLKIDGQNLIFILSAITPSLGFYVGGLIRYRFEKVRVR